MTLFLLSIIYVILLWVLFVGIFFRKEVIQAKEKDPAAKNSFEIILLYPGLQALVFYRIAHFVNKAKIPILPRLISQFARFLTGIEIHPAARIGKGFFIDHGMGVVIGETTIIGNNVLLYQGVTLGGTGKEQGKRHPTLGNNIVVGAGAKILGNILIGDNSYIGSNAVVIKDVPSNSTIVGVPGRVTRQEGKKMDFDLAHMHIVDPIMQQIEDLDKRIRRLEK